jgi:hypothetical protein
MIFAGRRSARRSSVLSAAAVFVMLSSLTAFEASATSRPVPASDVSLVPAPDPAVPSSDGEEARLEAIRDEQRRRTEQDQDRYYKDQAADTLRRYEQMDREADRYFSRP